MQDLRDSVKNINRCGEEKNRKLEIGPQNCIHSYPKWVLEYIGHLASRNILGKIGEDTYKISFADI